MEHTTNIVIENDLFSMVLNSECIVESLVFKMTGEELIASDEKMALFSLTEERPFNNEIKLAHPTQKTTFQANRVRREGDRLIVGFELIAFEAVVELFQANNYVGFRLVDFIVKPEHFEELAMTPPPVAEFRLLQLPVANRRRFGEWLNVVWDNDAAVGVLGTSPYARITSEKRKSCKILCADAVSGIKLRGCSAALVISAPEHFLDCVEVIEEDYGLPKGVKSRRSDWINRSIYWTGHVTPQNVDEHIAFAKKGGFSLMLINYYALVKSKSYEYCGDYDLLDEYPGGLADLKKMLEKIKAAGILPGFHFLHTHIGVRSRYMSPVADHRLNLTRHFTLARALGTEDSVVYVEENPEDCVMDERCRVLKFGGELISYEKYSTSAPYCFTGCKRGHWGTNVIPHALGTIGGLLDISEYLAGSVYLNQNSSLQDEIAQKIANIYNAGFEFAYFDGSEGTQPPFYFHVPNAQYRVYTKLNKEPLFCEGAAKAHFSWHMLSGGNAFDPLPAEVFKKNIARYPMEEASRMQNDFTRVNFGWWQYSTDIQPDMYEYGSSRAAAWDCPVTVLASIDAFQANPRTEDVLEVMRRWEDVRVRKWLTAEQKECLRDPDHEHILLINENGEYELVEYRQLLGVAGGSQEIRAFSFERNSRCYVVFWSTGQNLKMSLKISEGMIAVEEQLGGTQTAVERHNNAMIIPVSHRRYMSIEGSGEALIKALADAKILFDV